MSTNTANIQSTYYAPDTMGNTDVCCTAPSHQCYELGEATAPSRRRYRGGEACPCWFEAELALGRERNVCPRDGQWATPQRPTKSLDRGVHVVLGGARRRPSRPTGDPSWHPEALARAWPGVPWGQHALPRMFGGLTDIKTMVLKNTNPCPAVLTGKISGEGRH